MKKWWKDVRLSRKQQQVTSVDGDVFFFLNFWAKQFHYLFIYSFIINNNFLYWFVITWFTTIIYLPFFLTPVASPVSVPDEQRLFEDLMMGYEKSVRPVINANTILKVTFSLKLNQIIDLVSSVSQTSLVKKEIQSEYLH